MRTNNSKMWGWLGPDIWTYWWYFLRSKVIYDYCNHNDYFKLPSYFLSIIRGRAAIHCYSMCHPLHYCRCHLERSLSANKLSPVLHHHHRTRFLHLS